MSTISTDQFISFLYTAFINLFCFFPLVDCHIVGSSCQNTVIRKYILNCSSIHLANQDVRLTIASICSCCFLCIFPCFWIIFLIQINHCDHIIIFSFWRRVCFHIGSFFKIFDSCVIFFILYSTFSDTDSGICTRLKFISIGCCCKECIDFLATNTSQQRNDFF